MSPASPPASVLSPSKILCVGRNFGAHARELGNPIPTRPVLFLKPPSALLAPGQSIVLPEMSQEVHHEAEVAVVLSSPLKRCPDAATALKAIGAWTVANDVTARDLQREDKGRFTRAKGFDTFCPVSDRRLPTLDWATCRIQCRVDGDLRQDGALSDLIFPPGEILRYASHIMTLEAGDLILLGTPEGVGPIHAGERVEVRLVGSAGETLACLENPVEAG